MLSLTTSAVGIPWSVLTYSEEEDGYIVPITEEFLALVPKPDISEFSGWDNTAGRDAFYNYHGAYGVKPYW